MLAKNLQCCTMCPFAAIRPSPNCTRSEISHTRQCSITLAPQQKYLWGCRMRMTLYTVNACILNIFVTIPWSQDTLNCIQKHLHLSNNGENFFFTLKLRMAWLYNKTNKENNNQKHTKYIHKMYSEEI